MVDMSAPADNCLEPFPPPPPPYVSQHLGSISYQSQDVGGTHFMSSISLLAAASLPENICLPLCLQ